MFMLPKIRMGDEEHAISQVKRFRERLSRIRGRVPRRKLIRKLHYEIYSKLYAEETRGKKKKEATALVWKKVRNSLDVADATIRHFRYTGILTVKGSLLTGVETREADIDAILAMGLRPVEFFNDVDKFYDYVGNPDIPRLPFERETEIIRRIQSTSTYIEKLREQHGGIPSVSIPPIPSALRLSSLELNELKDLLDSLELARIEAQRIAQEDQLRQLDRKEIVDAFDRIVRGDEEFFDPPVYFEWNTYRALVAIDHAEVSPNFVLDEGLQPVSHAPGNKSDIVAEFGDFVLVTEVTLQTGKRQYMVESEPVVDHVGSFRSAEAKRSARKVYGLFMAPKVVQNTVNYFFVSAQTDYKEYGGPVTVIPLKMGQLQDLIVFSGKVGGFSPPEVRRLFDKLEYSRSLVKNPSLWLESIETVIDEWKTELQSSRSTSS